MHSALLTTIAALDPGDAGWGDLLFTAIWGLGTLLLAAYYCYRTFLAR
jgi:hypothetical protein